jgi:hypothetical protein
VIETLRRDRPDWYKICVPRRIVPPNGYANPRAYGIYHLAAASASHKGRIDDNYGAQIVSTSRLLEFRVPTYFISEDFYRAVAATEPPKETRIEDIKWPMPAMLLCLPLAFSKQYCGATGPFISVVHAPVGPYTVLGGRSGTNITEHSRVIIHAMVFYGPSPIDYINCTKTNKDIDSLCTAEFTTWEEDIAGRPEGNFNAPTKEGEIEVANKLNSLATKLLLAISARPEMREEGGVARPARIRNGEVEKEELWHPNMIGRQYRIVYEPGNKPEGSHASPRMHWRRGHIRNQKHGRNLCQTKLIWIDPVLVKAEGEQQSN